MSNRYNTLGGVSALIVLSLIIAAIVGWVLNIVEIAHATVFSGFVIVRAIGVFIPVLGAVLGYV